MITVIYVECSGGLGNQLFAWNTAHYLSVKFNDKVKVVFPKGNDTRIDRPFEMKVLSSFCVHDIKVRESRLLSKLTKLMDFLANKLGQPINKVYGRLGILHWDSHWDEIPSNLRKPKLVRGFFQNYQLMARSEGTAEIRAYLESLVIEIPSEIPNIQALHVRRGDYLANRNVIGVLSEKFYSKNAEENFPTIIFSDEVKLDFNLNQSHHHFKVLTPEHLSAWQTLACLTHAKLLVGANSTLSWWAAFFRGKGSTKFPSPMYKEHSLNSESLLLPEIDYVSSEFEE